MDTTVGAAEDDQLAIEPAIPTPPSPRKADVVEPVVPTLPSPSKAVAAAGKSA